VNELHHVLERAVITSTGGRLNVELLSWSSATQVAEAVVADANRVRTDAQIRQLEAEKIRAALKATNGEVSGPGGAAQLLGLKPHNLGVADQSAGSPLSRRA
jgi:transcriptional regulator with GAF, ATPase, and Fis domain